MILVMEDSDENNNHRLQMLTEQMRGDGVNGNAEYINNNDKIPVLSDEVGVIIVILVS